MGSVGGSRDFARSNAPSTHPTRGFTGGTPMTITTAKQLARQAEEARRAARQNSYAVQALRRQHLID